MRSDLCVIHPVNLPIYDERERRLGGTKLYRIPPGISEGDLHEMRPRHQLSSCRIVREFFQHHTRPILHHYILSIWTAANRISHIEAFNDPAWLFEPKYDGFRGLVYRVLVGAWGRSAQRGAAACECVRALGEFNREFSMRVISDPLQVSVSIGN